MVMVVAIVVVIVEYDIGWWGLSILDRMVVVWFQHTHTHTHTDGSHINKNLSLKLHHKDLRQNHNFVAVMYLETRITMVHGPKSSMAFSLNEFPTFPEPD